MKDIQIRIKEEQEQLDLLNLEYSVEFNEDLLYQIDRIEENLELLWMEYDMEEDNLS